MHLRLAHILVVIAVIGCGPDAAAQTLRIYHIDVEQRYSVFPPLCFIELGWLANALTGERNGVTRDERRPARFQREEGRQA